MARADGAFQQSNPLAAAAAARATASEQAAPHAQPRIQAGGGSRDVQPKKELDLTAFKSSNPLGSLARGLGGRRTARG